MRVLAEIWAEDFTAIPDASFKEAIREHRRKSQFWPTVAELIECLPRNAADERIQLPQMAYLTDKEIADNLAKVRELTATIFKDVKA